jgi:tRNA uridine 5-carbamoylmethylation protein Kti12
MGRKFGIPYKDFVARNAAKHSPYSSPTCCPTSIMQLQRLKKFFINKKIQRLRLTNAERKKALFTGGYESSPKN